jgi:hypothetical protein
MTTIPDAPSAANKEALESDDCNADPVPSIKFVAGGFA